MTGDATFGGIKVVRQAGERMWLSCGLAPDQQWQCAHCLTVIGTSASLIAYIDEHGRLPSCQGCTSRRRPSHPHLGAAS